jgi:hypothetical protein
VTDTLLRALVVWFGLVVLAVLNGVTRNSLITPRLGEQWGHVISTVILSVLIFAVAWGSNPWINPGTVRGAAAVGVFWVFLTVMFEFLAGHYVFGHPWRKLFADYNLARGRVWIFVLLATLLAPVWADRVRGH